MIIIIPPTTGDAYVDACFVFDFEEFDEPRVWHQQSGLRNIPLLADKNPKEALEAAEKALRRYPAHSFLYFWIGKLRGQLNYPDEPRKTYLEGLQKGRNKPFLCGGIAVWEFERGNLAEAVKWWIKSSAIQLGCKLSADGFSLLNLAYIATGLGLTNWHAPLLERAQRIQNIVFDNVGANERWAMAQTQGTESMKKAISLLCDFYL